MKNCIAPFLCLDDLVKASNETLYELACVIDKYFSTYCYYRLNKKFTSIKKEEATSKSLLPFVVLLQNSKIDHCFFQNFFMCIFHLCQRCSKSSNFFSHHVKSSLNRDRVHFTEESINQWKCI